MHTVFLLAALQDVTVHVPRGGGAGPMALMLWLDLVI
jgi:hypothetical protein